jgi:hypothetical protein
MSTGTSLHKDRIIDQRSGHSGPNVSGLQLQVILSQIKFDETRDGGRDIISRTTAVDEVTGRWGSNNDRTQASR